MEISRRKAHGRNRTITNVILDETRVNVCEHNVKTVPCESFGMLPEEWV